MTGWVGVSVTTSCHCIYTECVHSEVWCWENTNLVVNTKQIIK